MNSAEIKQFVRKFRKENNLKTITKASLTEVLESLGFTVISFNPLVNDSDVETLIRSLNLSEIATRSNGFLYADLQFRLVFVSEKLTEKEGLLVLAHELGHYVLGHAAHPAVVGRDVEEEYEANEFAHYLLSPTIWERVCQFVSKRKIWFLAGAIILFLGIGGGIAVREYQKRLLYESEYYVTATGLKYHVKGCVTIEGHKVRRLTKKDAESGLYEACSVCLPQE